MKSVGISILFIACAVAGSAQEVQPARGRDHIQLTGRVVRYDAALHRGTSQGDLILEVQNDEKLQYVRLRYSPNGFGFDAPKARIDQLLPDGMFSEGPLVWRFTAHTPLTKEELGACSTSGKTFGKKSDGRLVEVDRYTAVPGKEKEQVPEWRSLGCVITDNWSQLEVPR